MHDERHHGVHGSDANVSDGDTDTLAALISAAGKRAAPPRAAYEQVFAATRDAWRDKVRAKRTRIRNVALAASVAIVVIGAALIVNFVPRESATVVTASGIIQGDVFVRAPGNTDWQPLRVLREPITAGTRIRTTASGRIAFALPDTASLRIDAGSELTITAATQFELMAGTLYIDSGTGISGEPFAVTTTHGTVRDIGTQFEVTTAEQSLRVRIRAGAVRLERNAVDDVVGSAGEQLSLDANGGVERDFFAPHDPGWAWVETLAGAPEVEGKSLLAFLDWVARETGRELRFDAPVTETRVRTVILHGDASDLSPLQALDVMLSTTDFVYALRGDGAIVIRPRDR